jgi:hypothetical protein
MSRGDEPVRRRRVRTRCCRIDSMPRWYGKHWTIGAPVREALLDTAARISPLLRVHIEKTSRVPATLAVRPELSR